MSSNDKINFRSSPSNEIARPLSTYDNLNTTGAHDAKTIVTSAETESNGNTSTMENKNVNEFPFSGISFRFDELKQLQQNNASLNGYDNLDNNNYKSNVNNNHNISDNPNKQYNNINGCNQMRSTQGHTVTTIAQNHSLSALSSSSGSTSSSSDGFRPASLHFDDLTGNRNSNKPVHSAAKSQFFGLHKSDETGNNSRMAGTSNAAKRLQDDRENTGESSTVSDDEPLLNHFSNRIVATTSNHPSSSTSQYQNIPSNSAFFGQNQIINVNACTCSDGDAATEIQQYDSRQTCRNCLRSSTVNESMSGVPNSMANIDIASCSTSTKQITLDLGSSYRLSQSLSQVHFAID